MGAGMKPGDIDSTKVPKIKPRINFKKLRTMLGNYVYIPVCAHIRTHIYTVLWESIRTNLQCFIT